MQQLSGPLPAGPQFVIPGPPGAQLGGLPQLPLWQTCSGGHNVPQAPQLFGSLGSAQTPLQTMALGHVQLSFWQIGADAGHFMPQ